VDTKLLLAVLALSNLVCLGGCGPNESLLLEAVVARQRGADASVDQGHVRIQSRRIPKAQEGTPCCGDRRGGTFFHPEDQGIVYYELPATLDRSCLVERGFVLERHPRKKVVGCANRSAVSIGVLRAHGYEGSCNEGYEGKKCVDAYKAVDIEICRLGALGVANTPWTPSDPVYVPTQKLLSEKDQGEGFRLWTSKVDRIVETDRIDSRSIRVRVSTKTERHPLADCYSGTINESPTLEYSLNKEFSEWK